MPIRPLAILGSRLTCVQSILAMERWRGYPQFEDDKGSGRVALLACILSSIFGVHFILCLQFLLIRFGVLSKDIFGTYWTDETLQMAFQWSCYVITLCCFHLGEFFTTAICNPYVCTADSFMVNHSKAYTAAAFISWVEFWIRIIFFPKHNISKMFYIGIIFVIGGQVLRSVAMHTCGESFNHYIQQDKKENHVLITHGIYGILRHPSYVGFFYWSIGTQLILCNPVSTILYAVAAWTFFRYRIAFEEQTLKNLFPDGAYESYRERTYIGIPLIGLVMKFDSNNKNKNQ